MRGAFKVGAIVALIALLIAPAVYADDAPQPEDPGVRVRPPSGIAAEVEPSITFELFWFWLQIAI